MQEYKRPEQTKKGPTEQSHIPNSPEKCIRERCIIIIIIIKCIYKAHFRGCHKCAKCFGLCPEDWLSQMYEGLCLCAML